MYIIPVISVPDAVNRAITAFSDVEILVYRVIL